MVPFCHHKLERGFMLDKILKADCDRVELVVVGIGCELLGPGYQSWQKGKLRIIIAVEFCRDELVEQIAASNQPEINQLELPLDDIRLMINQDGQQENSLRKTPSQ